MTSDNDNVVPLQPRPEREPTDAAACANCGDQWFTLVSSSDIPTAVTMSQSGSVTGYHGLPHCVTCGQAWSPRGGWPWA